MSCFQAAVSFRSFAAGRSRSSPFSNVAPVLFTYKGRGLLQNVRFLFLLTVPSPTLHRTHPFGAGINALDCLRLMKISANLSEPEMT
jgi:hypothetical protein